MKVVLLNPPHAQKIQRRYMCSYYAQGVLLPPQELIALGGIMREFDECETQLIDAIAEDLTTDDLLARLLKEKPELIVAIQGFECFEDDINELNRIKEALPNTKLALFGHYSTLFYDEILRKTKVDIVLKGEPDLIFRQLVACLLERGNLATVSGIAFKTQSGDIAEQQGELRIAHPDELPMPAYELLKTDKYFEPFLKPPLGLIQSARGCPYGCNYCVRSFGKKLTYRTPEQIVNEILYLKNTFGINSLRFIDDTFTAQPKRVIDLCERILALNLKLDWTCLSRLDTLKEEMIPIMKKAGCKRIYFGVESGSPRVLKFLNKELDLEESLHIVKKCREAGIETLGWFIVGAPNEDEAAFEESVQYAIKADFDYIAVSELILYPGTQLYDTLKDEVDFSLLPYKNEWKDKSKKAMNQQREKEFYRRYYYRRRYVMNALRQSLKHPREYFSNALKLTSYLLLPAQAKRADYL